MKRLLVVCAASAALAAGVALMPLSTAAAATSGSTVSAARWATRHITIGAPRLVSFKAVSQSSGGRHPRIVAPVGHVSRSRPAGFAAGGLRGGVRIVPAARQASAGSGVRANTPPPANVLMSLKEQVALFGSDQNVEPPDTQVAAGPANLLEVVNNSLSVWPKTGGATTPLFAVDFYAFFKVPATQAFTDPRVVYDASSGRFFVSGFSLDASYDSQTYLAVSATSDPTGTWVIYTVQSNTAGMITDQPMTGVCSDKVVMAWNDFTLSGTTLTYDGAQTLVLQKSTLLAGTALGSTDASSTSPYASEFRLVPAQSLSAETTTCYMAVNNASLDLPGSTTSPTLGVISITGTPAMSDVALTENDLPIAVTNAPPAPRQPGGVVEPAANIDDRLLSAVWQNGSLWTSATDACTPPGDTTVRNCMRLDEVNTSGASPSLVQDFDASTPGLDEYYPAVSLDATGDLFVAYSASSAGQYPSACGVVSPALSVDAFASPVECQPGAASYPGTRWGDYSAAAPDPSLPGEVWMAGEYAPAGSTTTGNWGTAADGDNFGSLTGYPSITSADQATFEAGVSGSFGVTATGNPAPALTYTGTLPSGVTLGPSGALSGPPPVGAVGNYPIQITATNSQGSVTQTFTLHVQTPPGTYTPVGPVRVMDTRNGTGVPRAKVGPRGTISLQVAGVAGVPATGVTAVVLNVTVTDTTAGSYLTVYPDGITRPLASNLNFTAGQTIPNLVMVPVGADGKVDFYNRFGSVDLVADLAGYYTASSGGSLFAADGPARVLDTRNGTGVPLAKVGPRGTISLQVAGVDGVPATGVKAVVLNVTVTDTTAASYVTVFPGSSTRPLASNLNFTAGQTIANLVVVPVGADGKVDFYNGFGSIDLVADLAGYYASGGGSLFVADGPARVLDTRNGTGGVIAKVGPGGTIGLQVAGVDGVPASGVTAVVLNVTATDTTAGSYLTVYPDGIARPLASNLNFTAGQTIPNLVMVPVGADGLVDFYNRFGSVDLVADLAGYYTHATTSTTLTASATSVAQDSSVTFHAQVTANVGTPAGSVTFSDASNGSILGTSTLVSGTAIFTTAALAPGTRQLVARYEGSTSSAPSTSAELTISVAPGSNAVTYQIDPAHDGSQAFGTLSASTLTQKWKVTLGGTGGGIVEAGDVSYPVIAGGRVFVTVENTQTSGTELYALDATTGATDWSVALAGTYGFSALAYDGQVIFALNYDGLLKAFSASTGTQLWATQMPGQYAFTAPPTAYDGVVYVSGAGVGGDVYAVTEADGLVQWEATVANGDKSSPAVDDSGVYVSYACQQDYRFSLSGNLMWHHATGCSGGGGSTAVLDGSDVYARGSNDSPVILSKSAGASLGTFVSQTAPAFGSSSMYTIDNGNLVAVDPSGSPNRWSFGSGTLVTAPVVADGAVFVGSGTGTVYAVSATTGQQIWTGVAGSVIVPPDEQSADVLVGLAVGDGLLVVPAGNAITAFGN